MKKIFALPIFLLFSLIVISAGIAQTNAVKLYNGNKQATMPYVVTMKNGDLMVVFSDGTDSNQDARLIQMIYSQSANSWSAPKVAVARKYSGCIAQMFVDPAGDIHMAFVDGNSGANRDIYYSMYSNNTNQWSNASLVYPVSGFNSTWPRIQVENDLIYVVWTHDYHSDIGIQDMVMVVNKKGGTWPVDRKDRMTISENNWAHSIHGDFKVKDKKVYCVWLDEPAPYNWALFYSEGTYNPGANRWDFSKNQHIRPNDSNQYYPQLTLDPDGNVHVIYSYKQGPYFHIMKKPGSTTWSPPYELSRAGTAFNALGNIKYHGGLLHATWRESSAQGEILAYSRGLPDGSKWVPPITVGGGGAEVQYPEMTIDHNGDVHVVWVAGLDFYNMDLYWSKISLPGTPPQAVIEASSKGGLIPLTVTFDASKSKDPDGSIHSYHWDFGDGTKKTGKTVTHTFLQKGSYKVALSVIDNDLRIGTAHVEIFANTGEPIADIKVSGARGVVPFVVSFDGSGSYDTDGTIQSYAWEFGDGNTGSGPVVSHTYLKGGDYAAKLTVTDNDNKTNSTTVAIDVSQKPEAKFTASHLRGIIPLAVEFDASESVDEDGQIVSYQWTFGDGSTSQGQKIAYTFTRHGVFNVQLAVIDNDGFVDTAEQKIEAYGKPAAPTGVLVHTSLNNALLFKEAVNRVSWKNNPVNNGLFNIAQYRVYRKLRNGTQEYTKVGEVSATQTHFDDRKFANGQDAGKYDYAVTAVDDQGRESDLSSWAPAPGSM